MMVSPGALGFIATEDCALDRPVLRDPALQQEFEHRGYVVVPFLAPHEVTTLINRYCHAANQGDGINPPGAYNKTYAEFSVIHSRPEFRRDALDWISSTLGPHAERYLLDYRPLIANFVNKPPGSGVVPAHQNFSVVDETRFQSVSVWVPLVDCVIDNGAMWMLDGSHRCLRGRRGMWSYQAYAGIETETLGPLLTPLEVKAGDAVLLDDAIIHYSPPNLTGEPRLAIQFVMIPGEADALWFQQVEEGDGSVEVDVWRVEPSFFFEFWHGDGDERFGERFDRISLAAPVPPLDIDMLRALLARPPTAGRRGEDEPTSIADARPRGWRNALRWARARG